MKKQIEMYGGDMIAEYDETPELKDAVFQKLIDWYKKYNVSDGESFQNDDPQIYASILLADIVDNIIKFDTKCENCDNDELFN